MEKADKILEAFTTPEIIHKRTFNAGGRKGAALFNPDISDAKLIRSVLYAAEKHKGKIASAGDFTRNIIFASELEIISDIDEARDKILGGDTAVVLDGIKEIIIVASKMWDKRAVAEPPTETVIYGPREGFTEDFKTNLSLIERRLKTPNLAIEKIKIGRKGMASAAIIYVSDVAHKEVVNKVKKRLQSIDIDAVQDSHNLEPFLEEKPYSIFRQTGITEKPDVIAAKILEGRVAVMIEGSPMVITVPYLLIEDFHSNEDYYQRSSLTTFLRILRIVAVLFSLFLPGLYVAIQIFNYDIVPLRLLITIMNAVKGTPFSPLGEMLFVILLFEIIREASVRMPRAVGMAMSIVGALVLGETAVNAGLISSPAVMITAMSSIALFLVPNQIGTSTLLRLGYTVIGGVLGIYGLMIAAIFTLHYLVALEAYGTPYLAPLTPLIPGDLKDGVVKDSIINLNTRPASLGNYNKTRLKKK